MTLTALITTVLVAFLTFRDYVNNNYIIGDVVVGIEAYYTDGINSEPIDIKGSETAGVVELNISNPEQLKHFNNFRVNIKVYSSVDTYFRVAVYEQFTLTYLTGDKTAVVSVVKEDFSSFNYNDDFFDNRQYDGFFYYKNKVKRVDDSTPRVIEFIGELPVLDYHPIYESKYTLRIGFLIDAVQNIQGPQINWGLVVPPWSDEEEW